MELGVFSFNTETTIRPDELAVAAEERGFESVWFPEHTHIPASRESPFPGGVPLPDEYAHMADPFASAAAAAAVTTRIKIGTGICLLTERDPITLAKIVATVDRISEGRFLFGVGAGWNREEMAHHGTRFEERWAVFGERLAAMKMLWTEEEASFHGAHVDFERVWSYPKPHQRPHPPILLGTLGSRFGRARVVEYGDGWLPVGSIHRRKLEDDIRELHAMLREAGRDPAEVPISMFDTLETPERLLRPYADSGLFVRAIPRCPTADRDTVLRWLDRYAEIGHAIR